VPFLLDRGILKSQNYQCGIKWLRYFDASFAPQRNFGFGNLPLLVVNSEKKGATTATTKIHPAYNPNSKASRFLRCQFGVDR
jgi:hypothetical protein